MIKILHPLASNVLRKSNNPLHLLYLSMEPIEYFTKTNKTNKNNKKSYFQLDYT